MTANELIPLHETCGRGIDEWLFDGLICFGQRKEYVENVPCKVLSIGGFEDLQWHTVGSAIWIQSHAGRKRGMWYCLRDPAKEYKRFHELFLWLADLVKHLVDYLHNHTQVNLAHLRQDFHLWLQIIHGADEGFRKWLKVYNDTDFRRIVAAHAIFLYDQAFQLGHGYALHPLWNAIDTYAMDALPRQPQQIIRYDSNAKTSSSSSHQRTVVTPFVYDCFKHLPWARYLDKQYPSSGNHGKRSQNKSEVIVDSRSAIIRVNMSQDIPSEEGVNLGEVVAIQSDLKTKWKSDGDSLWYAYVQDVSTSELGTKLDLIWLYKPSDTPCQSMRYPHINELFLSDHCNCGDRSIFADEVISKPKVAFFGDPSTTSNDNFFVRQKYIGADSAWVTLMASDFQCACKAPQNKMMTYPTGTTLLVDTAAPSSKPGVTLEPVELLHYEDNTKNIRFRRLLRRSLFEESAHPNELIYTSVVEGLPSSRIVRSCNVRFYTGAEKIAGEIPVPYCRRGVGDFYYIILQACSDEPDGFRLAPLHKPWPTNLRQGYDPTAWPSASKLRGLDIFCGGGNLGRGIEEGGAVNMEWAVDYATQAIHTYWANTHDPDKVKHFNGSVNDYLSQAMKGKQQKLVAQFGEPDVIVAGNSCQGFSLINHNKTSEQSQIYISMVASVVSFVDYYRPKYAILENVPGMAKCGPKDKDSNTFAQVLCALVAMGYQVCSYILDAWNFGSPQSRSRLFISITAPGLVPLSQPPQSHSHPNGINDRSLGKTANGLPLGERYWAPTPFKSSTIREALDDLPPNEDGKVDCIPFPDHRCTRKMSSTNQALISQIPKHPHGMGLVQAVNKGWMTQHMVDAWNLRHAFRARKQSRAWKRVCPDTLLPTVTTACTPQDAISGQWLHWEYDRQMTVMEARRAQGYPDYEVILGSPAMQWKIIGNSVDRRVALALGGALRAAWVANEASASRALGSKIVNDLTATAETQLHSNTAPRRVRPLAYKYQYSSTENPIHISSDSELESGDAAIFTPSAKSNATRETTSASEVTVIDEEDNTPISGKETKFDKMRDANAAISERFNGRV